MCCCWTWTLNSLRANGRSGIQTNIQGCWPCRRGDLLDVMPTVCDAFDHIVIDGAAVMTQRLLSAAVIAADAVLIPVQPSGLDIWGAADIVKIVKARQALTSGRPKAAFVVSRQVLGTRFAAGVQARLEQMGMPVFTSRLTQRIDFAEAATAGQSVLDYRPTGKAAQEIIALTHELERFTHARH